MKSLLDWIISRGKEPSTWRGIIGALTVAGVVVSPELAEYIIGAGVSLISIFEIMRKEKKADPQ